MTTENWIASKFLKPINVTKWLTTFALGSIVDILIVSLFAGGIAKALGIIALSIICTGGVGLIIIIPVPLVTGSLVLWFIMGFKYAGQSDNRFSSDFKIADERQALDNYVTAARKTGWSDGQIKTTLVNNGWQESDIKKYFLTSSS